MTGEKRPASRQEKFDPFEAERRFLGKSRIYPEAVGGGSSGNHLAGAGIQFAAGIIVFVLIGAWLDRKMGTTPIFVLLGVALGGGGGFFLLYRSMTAAQKGSKGESTIGRTGS